MTLWEYLRKDWYIKKSVIKNDLEINPDKDWNDVTVGDLNSIADYLDIGIDDFF